MGRNAGKSERAQRARKSERLKQAKKERRTRRQEKSGGSRGAKRDARPRSESDDADAAPPKTRAKTKKNANTRTGKNRGVATRDARGRPPGREGGGGPPTTTIAAIIGIVVLLGLAGLAVAVGSGEQTKPAGEPIVIASRGTTPDPIPTVEPRPEPEPELDVEPEPEPDVVEPERPEPANGGGPDPSANTVVVRVASITDGDTFKTTDGRKIRMIGMNTPERGRPLYGEAGELLGSIIGEQEVTLEFDIEETDRYKRSLCYVWKGSELVNETIVRKGMAFIYVWEPNTKHQERLLAAQKLARADGLGLWALPPRTPEEVYIGAKGGHHFHRPDCADAKKISKSRVIRFRSRDEALDQGFNPDDRKCEP